MDAGESAIEAARRETIEETGCDVVLGAPLPLQQYKVDSRPKTVDYWVGRERPGGPGFAPNKEIDEVRWLPGDQAVDLLTYPRDADLVHQALATPVTTPLIILRHAQAVRRSDYPGRDDARRPLSAQGDEQARRLVGLLDAFGVGKVYSSDYTRCLDTVRPFAHARHVTVAHEPLIGEEGFASSRKATLIRVDEILAESQPAVVCTHRPVLPALVLHVADRLGVHEAPDPALEPGQALVFHISGEHAVAVERISS